MGKLKSMIMEVREMTFAGLNEEEIASRLGLAVDIVEEMVDFIHDMEFNYPYNEPEYADL